MKVSVIIPVFNVENYINRCLDSILAQTLIDIEVICIDDCSTDNSYEIVRQYAAEDIRLKCFRNEQNIGQGLTRSRGLDIAQGEYVAFVDSDDWIEPNMYESLYEVTNEKKYDLVCCNLSYDFMNGESKSPKMPSLDLITRDFLLKEAIAPTLDYFSPNSPCDKIYRREYIKNNNLRFLSERDLLYEDKFFNIEFLVSDPSIYFIPKVFYHYMVRNGSTMVSYRKNLLHRYFLLDDKIKKVLKENFLLTPQVIQRLEYSLFEQTFNFLLNALVYNNLYRGKIHDFYTIIRDKRISLNAKKFKKEDIPKSTSLKNRIIKFVCFVIIKYFN